jgi:hypothetical protein
MGKLIDFLLDGGKPDYLLIKPFYYLADEGEKKQAVQDASEKIYEKAQKFVSNAVFWETLRVVLEKALTAADKGEFTKAFLRLTEASVLINRAEESEGLRNLKIRLAIFPVVWMLGLLGFQVLVRFLQSWQLFPSFPQVYFGYLWAGMIGGTTIVLWGIVKHSAELNFDHTYTIWYLLKPGIGAVMAVVAVLVMKAGFLSVEGEIQIKNQIPLYLLAFVVGFSERFFLRILDRVITAVLGGDSSVSIQNLMLRPAERYITVDFVDESTEPVTPNPKKKTTKGTESGAHNKDKAQTTP